MSETDNNFEELNKEKYELIVETFEDLFQKRGYSNDINFSNKVWFLEFDPTFKSINNKETPLPSDRPNLMIETLMKLNESNSLEDLSVNTGDFIKQISKVIIDSHKSIKMSEESIEKNESKKKIGQINEIINILNEKIRGKNKGDFYSILHSRILSLNDFPSGPYKIKLGINTAFDLEDTSDLNQSEKNNLNQNISDSVYNLFTEENLICENLINIPFDSNNVSFRNKSSKNEKDINNFPEYKFSILNKDSKNYLVDRRYSGTTFSNLRLNIKGGKTSYESDNEYMLYVFISLIDDLCDLSKNYITKEIVFDLKKNDKDKKNRTCEIELGLELDNLTRLGIINRIKELNQITIDNQSKNQMIIDEILTDYFPQIKDSIKDILKESTLRDSCCTCNLF